MLLRSLIPVSVFALFSVVSHAGHLEPGTSLTLDQAKASPTLLVPEYEPTNRVIVSDLLLWPETEKCVVDGGKYIPPKGLGNLDLIKALDAGCNGLIATSCARRLRIAEISAQGALAKDRVSFLNTSDTIDKEAVYGVFRALMGNEAREQGWNPRQLTATQMKTLEGTAYSLILETESIGHMFTRDFSPVFGMSPEGRYRLLDHNFDVHRPVSDQVPRLLANAWGKVADRISIPLYNVGGNLTCNRKDCFMADFVVFENSPAEIKRKQYWYPDDKSYSRAEIEALYNAISVQKFTIVPRMPHEPTGHIDVWLKFVSEDTLLISSLSDEAIQSDPRVANNRALAQALTEIQTFLSAQKIAFEKRGYRVIAIPMMLPLLPKTAKLSVEAQVLNQQAGAGSFFYSYVNSALLVTRDRRAKVAVVPRYKTVTVNAGLKPEAPEHYDQKLIPAYEDEVRKGYEAAGFSVVFVNVDHMVSQLGSIHCSTSQIPYSFVP